MATLYYRPYTSEPLQEGEMPAHDAMENVLPEYQYIFVDPNAPRPTQVPALHKLPDDLDKTSLGLLDYQMHELERYRIAVQKMGTDILSLRQEIRDLQGDNSGLKRDLSRYNDATKLLLDSQELDGLTKPELAARYVALKQKLTSQTGELRDYKARVQELQNDLIKKNDAEKNLLRMSHAHQSQNELVLKLQDRMQKVKRLEEACRKQEKVIDKMERLISKDGNKDSKTKAANDALMEENRRLRSELDDLREHTRDMASQREPREEDEEEKLQLYQKLSKAEGRVMSLEQQLAENARRWGRDKSELAVKLQEAELGLRRASPLPADLPPRLNYVTPRSHVPKDEPRRYSKAPPRKPKPSRNYDLYNY